MVTLMPLMPQDLSRCIFLPAFSVDAPLVDVILSDPFCERMIERSYHHYIIICVYCMAAPATLPIRVQEISTASASFTDSSQPRHCAIQFELGRIMKLHAPRKHRARHARVNLLRPFVR